MILQCKFYVFFSTGSKVTVKCEVTEAAYGPDHAEQTSFPELETAIWEFVRSERDMFSSSVEIGDGCKLDHICPEPLQFVIQCTTQEALHITAKSVKNRLAEKVARFVMGKSKLDLTVLKLTTTICPYEVSMCGMELSSSGKKPEKPFCLAIVFRRSLTKCSIRVAWLVYLYVVFF